MGTVHARVGAGRGAGASVSSQRSPLGPGRRGRGLCRHQDSTVLVWGPGGCGEAGGRDPHTDGLEAIDTADGRPDRRDDPLPSSDQFLQALQSAQKAIHKHLRCPACAHLRLCAPFPARDSMQIKKFTIRGQTLAWKGPYTVILPSPTAIKVNGIPV
ncbi:uncharacterized protein WM277_021379 isoform 1-T1 [Molossus nigricans]